MNSMYASIGRRFVAFFLDILVLAIPMFIANHILPVIGGILVPLLYAPVLEASELRATLGKHWMGIQVTDLSGRRISHRDAVVRLFMKWVSSLIFFLGHAVALFTARKQALHDLVADTIVVYGRNECAIADAWLDSARALFRIGKRDRVTELERLQELREKGAITEEEFQREKERLLR